MLLGGEGARSLASPNPYSARTTCDIDKARANDGVDRREAKPKRVAVVGATLALEATRATLAWVRRAFVNIEAMDVVKRRLLRFAGHEK